MSLFSQALVLKVGKVPIVEGDPSYASHGLLSLGEDFVETLESVRSAEILDPVLDLVVLLLSLKIYRQHDCPPAVQIQA